MVRGSHVPPAQQAAGFADWPALKGLAAGRLGVLCPDWEINRLYLYGVSSVVNPSRNTEHTV